MAENTSTNPASPVKSNLHDFKLVKLYNRNSIPERLLPDCKGVYKWFIFGDTPLCKWFIANGALQGELVFID